MPLSRNVEVLIYVFDVDSGDFENEVGLFDGILGERLFYSCVMTVKILVVAEAMEQNSPDANIFVLIHKMDMVAVDDRERAFLERSAVIHARSEQ
jgi:Ras-related GTP-binding protein A/B